MTLESVRPTCGSNRLPIDLVGATAALRDVVIIGGIIGVVSGIGPLYQGEPLLFFFPAAWFLYTVSRVYPFLRSPRSDSWPFVLGVSFAERLRLGFRFVNRKNVELAGASGVALAVFYCLGLILYKDTGPGEMFASAEIMAGEAIVFYAVLALAIGFPVLRPSRRDEHPIRLFAKKNHALARRIGVLVLRAAELGSGLLTGEAQIIAKRNLLYLIRYDGLSLIFFGAAAATISILVAVMYPDRKGFVSGIILLAGPIVVAIETTATMSESAFKIATCPYYSFGSRNVLLVNFAIAISIMVPAMLLYAAKLLIIDSPVTTETLLRIVAFLLSSLAFGIAMSFRWLSSSWTAISLSGVVLMMLGSLAGLAVPYYGPIFPLASIVLLLVIGKQ